MAFNRSGTQKMNSVDKIANNTCIYGIMGGLRPTATGYFNAPGMVYDKATNSFNYWDSATQQVTWWPSLPCRPLPGQQSMAGWLSGRGLLSRNPAGSAMVGRLYPGGGVRCCP